MEAVIERLEAVATRLEHVQGRLGAGSVVPAAKPAAAAAPAAPAAAGAAPDGDSLVTDFQQSVIAETCKMLDTAEAVGGEVLRGARVLAECFRRQEVIVRAMAERGQPPDAAELQALLAPLGEQLAAAGDLAGAAGPRSPFTNHFKLVGEAAQALGWVAYTGPNCGVRLPAQHVDDCVGACEFYQNKVLKDWRAKDPNHVAWVQAVRSLLLELKAFCARRFPAGPTWGRAGGGGSAGAAAAAKPAAAPLAPPPPAGGPGSLVASKAPAAAAAPKAAPAATGMAALFSEINKGGGITSGLRKVTADMKTKNREDRSSAVPAAAPADAAAGGGGRAAAPRAGAAGGAPPRIECEQGRKWVVENHAGNREIVISDTEPRQTVYIFNCNNCTIQVKGKVNAITMDGCRRSGLVFEDVVAACEVVNCSACEVQAAGALPTLAVDNCEGVTVYLSAASLAADITTAKSSAINVLVPGAAEDSDMAEFPIPEQFVSRYRAGRFVTEPVSHSGG